MGQTENIKAITTIYRGVRFRSRLEARWAVFFDELKIKWEYEPEGFLLGDDNSTPYLPDFRLPSLDCYVEVKPTYDQQSLLKLYLLYQMTGVPCLLFYGSPRLGEYTITRLYEIESYVAECPATKMLGVMTDMYCVQYEFVEFDDTASLLEGYKEYMKINKSEKFDHNKLKWIGLFSNELFEDRGQYNVNMPTYASIPRSSYDSGAIMNRTRECERIVDALSMASSFRFELGDRGVHYQAVKFLNQNNKPSAS